MRTGPKGIYTEDYARQAYLLALEGVTEKRMAELWGIHINTLTDWKHSYPEFNQAIQMLAEGLDVYTVLEQIVLASERINRAFNDYIMRDTRPVIWPENINSHK